MKAQRRAVFMPNLTEADAYTHQSDPEAWVAHHVAKAQANNGPHALAVLVDRPLATALLNRNPVHWNRTISKMSVTKWGDAMERDDWMLNGENLIVAMTGELNNGQHRLTACVERDAVFPTMICFGIDRDSRTTLDQGKKRSLRDMLEMRGYRHSGHLGSAATTLLGVLRKDINILSHGGATPQQVLAILEDHPGIVDGDPMIWGNRMFKAFRVSPGIFAALYYLAEKRNRTIAPKFFESICYNLFIERRSDPRARLIERLRLHATRAERMSRAETAGIFVKAWNLLIRGEDCGPLYFRKGGRFEEFPSLDDIDADDEKRLVKLFNK